MASGRDAFGNLTPLQGETRGGKCAVWGCPFTGMDGRFGMSCRNVFVCEKHTKCECGKNAVTMRGSIVMDTAHFVCAECDTAARARAAAATD